MAVDTLVEELLDKAREAIGKRRYAVARKSLEKAYSAATGAGIKPLPDIYRLSRHVQRRTLGRHGFRRNTKFFTLNAVDMLGSGPNSDSRNLSKILAEFEAGKIESDFGLLLMHFAKPSVNVSPEELDRYELELTTPLSCPSIMGFSDAYFDATYNFCLTYDAELMAIAGFRTWFPGIIIAQIQGMPGTAAQLNPFFFSQALVTKVLYFADQNKIPSVLVPSVDNMRVPKERFDELKAGGLYPSDMTFEAAKHLSSEKEQHIRQAAKDKKIWTGLMPHQGFLLYDETARQLHFTKMPDGNYQQVLSTP